eukprot:COSAG06_NODE_13757_length_1222_cov_2.625111_2_plen_205_part_00
MRERRGARHTSPNIPRAQTKPWRQAPSTVSRSSRCCCRPSTAVAPVATRRPAAAVRRAAQRPCAPSPTERKPESEGSEAEAVYRAPRNRTARRGSTATTRTAATSAPTWPAVPRPNATPWVATAARRTSSSSARPTRKSAKATRAQPRWRRTVARTATMCSRARSARARTSSSCRLRGAIIPPSRRGAPAWGPHRTSSRARASS